MRSSKCNITEDLFLPVPTGTKIRYQHYYVRNVRKLVAFGKHPSEDEILTPPRLIATGAWLADAQTGAEIKGTYKQALVHPNDTAVKKLGRLKAHNRCIAAYNKMHG